jgi:hypothetical protein
MTDATAAGIAAVAALVGSGLSALVTFQITKRQVKATAEQGDANRSHDSEVHHQDRNHALRAEVLLTVSKSVYFIRDNTLNELAELLNDRAAKIGNPPSRPESYVDALNSLTILYLAEDTQVAINQLVLRDRDFRALVMFKVDPVRKRGEELPQEAKDAASASGKAVLDHVKTAFEKLRVEMDNLN